MKIPSTKNQISNKSQHAAQAPALSVTQIQNPKQMIRLNLCPKALSTDRASFAKRYGPTAVPVLVIGY